MLHACWYLGYLKNVKDEKRECGNQGMAFSSSRCGKFHSVVCYAHRSWIASLAITLFFHGTAAAVHLHDLRLESLPWLTERCCHALDKFWMGEVKDSQL